VGLGIFYFYEMMLLTCFLRSGWDGFDDKEDAAKMTRVVKVAWGRSKQLSLLSLSALTPIGMLKI
jgi:hypothetical protein